MGENGEERVSDYTFSLPSLSHLYAPVPPSPISQIKIKKHKLFINFTN